MYYSTGIIPLHTRVMRMPTVLSSIQSWTWDRPSFVKFLLVLLLGLTSRHVPAGSPVQDTQSKASKFKVIVIDESPTLTKISAVNSRGEAIGIREVENQKQFSLEAHQFFRSADGRVEEIKPLTDYTNLELSGLSDDGMAVGFCSRPLGSDGGSLTAVVWNSKTKVLTDLGKAPGDTASHAQSISEDGRKIVGYTTGSDPARLRPCVWNHQSDGAWTIELLETIHDYNPYLMASRAVISPNAQLIAGCITVAFLPNGQIDSSLFVWQHTDSGWKRHLVSDEQLWLGGINNSGTIGGGILQPHGRMPCLFDASGKMQSIQLLAGDVTGEIWGVDAAGIAYGISDDPHGPEGGPVAIAWHSGETTRLPLGSNSIFNAAYCVHSSGTVGGLMDVTYPGKNAEEPTVRTVGFILQPIRK
ncbi:MAG: hypothetical protein KDB03_03990 [Planctomycetales bacterium]|nr:hypothetical protein [Planctomycetales bacterium]